MSNYNKIAIVGIACRFPGGIESLEDYWRVLKNGEDVVTQIPDSRWSKEIFGHPKRKVPGRSYSWSAGVMSQVDQFDAEFFGISRREAEQMDPQQRLLLELTWEAFENGGLHPNKIAGSNCGVFIGIGSNDYMQRKIDDLAATDAYFMTGVTASIGSNRISYIFDLRGPSMSIDTACSSSLVALHQACNSINNSEASMAVAGGVNMLLHPLGFIGFSKASMLSPTGRCKAFDASGDGYVRAEGAAIVILKSLAQATADGDKIYAVIAGSGVNCDGKTNGMTVPSPEAQALLLNNIYSQAEIEINDIAYIEAHGTGTAVGDPLETKGLSMALGSHRRKDNPLLIGSAKTNLGHLEVASGMAGLLKTVLCLKHRALPKNLHFNTPNPHIHFQEWNLKVVEQFTLLPDSSKPLVMGVNSFGFGGANAHVLLEEYQTDKNPAVNYAGQMPPLFLSARKDTALAELATQYADLISTTDANHYYDIAWSALYHRQPLEQRVAIFADDKAGIVKNLTLFAKGETTTGIVSNEVLPEKTQLAFVYSGNGCQWLGMGCVLFKENKIFRNTVKEIDKYWQQYADFSIEEELFANKDNHKLQLTEVAQPLLFAFQVALTRMLQSFGLTAGAAFGHSVGEVAAVWASGALTLKQAVHVIYERSFAQAQTQGLGKMAAVGLSAQQMQEKLNSLNVADKVVIAGINSPTSVTISGDEQILKEMEAQMLDQSIFFRLLDLDYAFHSPYMDPIAPRVRKGLEELKPGKAKHLRFISTVTGTELAGENLNAEYWWHNIREPVEFSAAVNTLIADGFYAFVEIGAHPVLCRYVEQCLQAAEKDGKAIATIKRQEESVSAVRATVYNAYLSGVMIDHAVAFPTLGKFVTLPSYPWQRERYWHEPTATAYGLIDRRIDNPLLGYRLKDAQATWESPLDTVLMPWLADHEVGGVVVVPAAGYVEMALAASKVWFGGTAFEIEELDITAPIVLDAEHLKVVNFKIATADGTFSIGSRDYISHNVTGRLLGAPMQKSTRLVSIIPALTDAPKKLTSAQHYQLTKAVGLNYGSAFQGIDQVWLWPEQKIVWARLALPEKLKTDAEKYLLHPALLDSCFQLLVDLFREQIEGGQCLAMIPVRVGKLRFYGDYGQPKWGKLELKHYSRKSVVADFTLLDSEHNTVAILNNVRFRSVSFVKGAEHYPATYVYTNKLMPHSSIKTPTPLLTFKALTSSVLRSLKSKEPWLKREQHFNEVLPLFDVLVTAYCFEAITELMQGQASCSVNELVASNTILDAQIELLLRILAIVKEDNLVSYHGDKWSIVNDVEMPESGAIWRTILADYPEYLPELVLMAQCGSNLVEVLCGKIAPAALLSPPKSSTKEYLYGNSRSWGVANLIIADILTACVKQWPDNRRLRILEITSGQCELTQALLNVLPAKICDYVLLDADDTAIAHTQAIFEPLDFFKALQLDIENLPETLPESVSFGSFDIVIVANTLHKVHDLNKTVATIKQFLVSEGMLLLQERGSDRFTDITCGLEPDWWLYDEESGAASARLLSANSWMRLLETQGFVETKTIVEPEAIDNPGVFVTLAKNSAIIAPVAQAQAVQTWVILLDETTNSLALYTRLATELAAVGQRVIALQSGSQSRTLSENHFIFNPEDPAALRTVLAQIQPFQHFVHLHGWDAAADALDTKLATQRCLLAVAVLQGIEKLAETTPVSLWLVTSGAAVYEYDDEQELGSQNPINPAQAALWGFGRVAMNEYPHLNIRLLDLPNANSIAQTCMLLKTEFLSADKETEVVITSASRQVLRMQRTVLKARNHKAKKNGTAVALDFKAAGSLHNLYWRTLESSPPLGANQIQIRPYAAGLNFRDVMYAMGMLSDEAVENGFAGATLGMELSGIVERVGKNVEAFKPGDEVISFAPASFSTRVITETTATALKPAHWSHEQATTVPTTFFTVYYALHHLARLQPGEKILIHGAAGGVGLAAIQYAQYIGAEIFATAGSAEKRAFVKMMGADHVMDSRSMAFADEVMLITDGKGVDVVLNSLSGEAIWRNLSILRPFGRFLELGKRDFYENSKIGLRPFRNNISYYGIDADQLLIERKELAAALFQEMMKLFTDNILRPLPFRAFPAAQVVDAFRYMQQSRQIGKIVLSFHEVDLLLSQVERPLPTLFKLDAHASYLVSGGLGGFGLKTAQWLVEKGAKHLILLGRSGASSKEATQAIQDMEAQGVSVYVYAMDVCNNESMTELFAQIAYCAPPLKGLIHAAALIDDGLISQLDEAQFRRVLNPKIQGSYNLHCLTEKLNLDFFVLYSSMTTFLGNPGQANYVAANSYLESLAHYRRQKGLAGLYVAWGPIADVGFLTRHAATKDTLEARIGSKAIDSNIALQMLEKLLLADSTGAAVIDFDWSTISRFMPAAKSPKYEQQLLQANRPGGDHSHENIKSVLTTLSAEEALTLIAQLLAQEVGQILRLPTEKIDIQKSVFDLGMDSLMGMELAIAIETRFEVKLPLMALAEGATIFKLAGRIIELLQTDHSSTTTDAQQETVRALASRHEEDVSEDIINKLVDSIKTPAKGGVS